VNRRLPDFIEGYLEYTKNTESPLAYHLWSALGCVSAALERKVYVRWGHTEVFANQYIVLVGPSGCRKGEPIMIARRILEEVGVICLAESMTKQQVIRRIKDAVGTYESENELKTQCAVSLVAEEFAIFIGDGDTGFLADLTNWYDARGRWRYETKHSGIDEIVGVCFNIISSMAPDWIPLAIPQAAIGGGFTSRIMFIVEHRKGRSISNPNAVPIDDKLYQKLQEDLEIIHTLKGEATFDTAGLAAYESWYIREDKRAEIGKPAVDDTRFSGYIARRATHVKKVAMVCSAARSDTLVITEIDFKRALLFMENAERAMADVFGKVGRSLYVEQTQEVMNYIKARGKTTRSEVMQQFYRDLDYRSLEAVESAMQAMRIVTIARDTLTGDAIYTWVKGKEKSD